MSTFLKGNVNGSPKYNLLWFYYFSTKQVGKFLNAIQIKIFFYFPQSSNIFSHLDVLFHPTFFHEIFEN